MVITYISMGINSHKHAEVTPICSTGIETEGNVNVENHSSSSVLNLHTKQTRNGSRDFILKVL